MSDDNQKPIAISFTKEMKWLIGIEVSNKAAGVNSQTNLEVVVRPWIRDLPKDQQEVPFFSLGRQKNREELRFTIDANRRIPMTTENGNGVVVYLPKSVEDVPEHWRASPKMGPVMVALGEMMQFGLDARDYLSSMRSAIKSQDKLVNDEEQLEYYSMKKEEMKKTLFDSVAGMAGKDFAIEKKEK